MKVTIFSKLAYKIMTLLIALLYSFNGYIAPAKNDPIQTNAQTGAKLTVAVWADPQVSNYMLKRIPYFDAACEDIANSAGNIDAVLVAGDIAENGLKCEYQYIYEKLNATKTDNFLIAEGNHDVRLKFYKNTVKNFTGFVNSLNKSVNSQLEISSLSYRYDINGYTFIILGTDKTEFEESYFSDSQLDRLDKTLNETASSGKPVFVVCHQPLKLTHGLPDTWNSPFDFAGSVGEQSDALAEIMNRYPNVIFVTGHLHTGIGEYTYEKIGNIHSVNLPSLTINNKDGDCNDNGIGFMAEVYDDCVLFRAKNFAQGKYLPEYDINIPLL